MFKKINLNIIFSYFLIIFKIVIITQITYAASGEQNSGMPQLDVQTFSSQIFWLVVTFLITFLILKLSITPKLSEILSNRKNRIDSDILEAKKAKEEAEKVKLEQEKSISDAKSNAALIVKEVIDKSNHTIRENETIAKEKFQKKISEAEKKILSLKSDILNNISDTATDLTILITQKFSGSNISLDLASKAVSESIKNSDLISNKKMDK
tara:strand:+ start:74 stop:703 length:630 start_codon:yes stop_codon:yes gene_type:complete